jgi:hypothetical protein
MKTVALSFALDQRRMLFGLMSLMYAQGQTLPDKGRAWVIIGRKVNELISTYNEDEIELLKLAVGATITAGEKALASLPEENVAARVRTGVVQQTYLAIMEKLTNVIWQQTGQQHDQEPQNLRGNDEERKES